MQSFIAVFPLFHFYIEFKRHGSREKKFVQSTKCQHFSSYLQGDCRWTEEAWADGLSWAAPLVSWVDSTWPDHATVKQDQLVAQFHGKTILLSLKGIRVVEHWDGLPGVAVEPPSLQVFKAKCGHGPKAHVLVMGLSGSDWWLDWMSFTVFSNRWHCHRRPTLPFVGEALLRWVEERKEMVTFNGLWFNSPKYPTTKHDYFSSRCLYFLNCLQKECFYKPLPTLLVCLLERGSKKGKTKRIESPPHSCIQDNPAACRKPAVEGFSHSHWALTAQVSFNSNLSAMILARMMRTERFTSSALPRQTETTAHRNAGSYCYLKNNYKVHRDPECSELF